METRPYKCKCSNIELAGQSSTVAEANDKRRQKWSKIISEGALILIQLLFHNRSFGFY